MVGGPVAWGAARLFHSPAAAWGAGVVRRVSSACWAAATASVCRSRAAARTEARRSSRGTRGVRPACCTAAARAWAACSTPGSSASVSAGRPLPDR